MPAPLPETMSPQLATLATALPTGGRWIVENKFDGYRLMACIDGGKPRLVTRGGHDWTDRLPALAHDLEALGIDTAWLDGEIVVAAAGHDAAVRNDFNALQNAFDRSRTQAVEYFVFDLPYFAGHDLRGAPLAARRELLRQLLQDRPPSRVHFSETLAEGSAAAAARALQSACEVNGEGIIAKRHDAPYRATRSTSWLKLKCQQRQEFVVAGYTDRSDDATAVGSLVLGVHDAEGRLVHAGSVGTGFTRAAAQALRQQLKALHADQPPFDAGSINAKTRWPRRAAGQERWVKPRLVVEVGFAEWTPAGHIRHASFVGVRTDKPPRAIVREQAVSPNAVKTATRGAPAPPAASESASASASQRRTPPAKPAGPGGTPTGGQRDVRVTHPERVIDRVSGLTKLDLVRYYDSVAEAMLPHLRGRPVALLRAPGGVEAPAFFQKHADKGTIAGVDVLDPGLWPGHDALLEVRTAKALRGAAQMNTIEFHTWNSVKRTIAKPDRMVFDLDPGEGVDWAAIREGASLTHALLEALGLRAWLKTSGGKGLHLVVPLAARWDYDTVKGFSQAVVHHLARTLPGRFVAKSGPANRKGRIFVDYLRNGEGATTVAAFSARARPGLGVSMPVDWNELDSIKSAAQWHVGNARDRLSLQHTDPWADMATTRQSLAGPMKALDYEPPARPAG